jgi:uncharacterized protein
VCFKLISKLNSTNCFSETNPFVPLWRGLGRGFYKHGFRKASCALLLLLLVTGTQLYAQRAPYYPEAIGLTSDYEHTFTKEQIHQLDSAVISMLRFTRNVPKYKNIELAVITVTDSMFGNTFEMSDYASKIGEAWGVGGTAQPNCAIVLAYSKSLRKVALVTGDGLDTILPANICNGILVNVMAPQFKQGNYFQAMLMAVGTIKEYLILHYQ